MAFGKLYMFVNPMNVRGLGLLLPYAICEGSSGWALGMDIELLSCIQKRFTHSQWQAVLVAEVQMG